MECEKGRSACGAQASAEVVNGKLAILIPLDAGGVVLAPRDRILRSRLRRRLRRSRLDSAGGVGAWIFPLSSPMDEGIRIAP